MTVRWVVASIFLLLLAPSANAGVVSQKLIEIFRDISGKTLPVTDTAIMTVYWVVWALRTGSALTPLFLLLLLAPSANACIRAPPEMTNWTRLHFTPPFPDLNDHVFAKYGFDITCSNMNDTRRWSYQEGLGLQYFDESSGHFEHVVFSAMRRHKLSQHTLWTNPSYFRKGNAKILAEKYTADHKGREITIRVRPASEDKLLRYRCKAVGMDENGYDKIDYSNAVYYY